MLNHDFGEFEFSSSAYFCLFTAQALGREENQGDSIIKPHIRQVNARIQIDSSVVEDNYRRLHRIGREIEVLKSNDRTTHNLKIQTRVIRKVVDDKRKFLPSRVMRA